MKDKLLLVLLLVSSISIAQERRVLTLQECIEIGVENNLNVQRSELEMQRSQVDLRQSRAQRYPTFNVGGNYGFNWGRGIDPTTNQFIDQRINFNGLSGNSSMALINGMQVNNSIKQNKLSMEASREDLQKTINDISLNIASIYLNVIFNKELLENANFQLESSKQQLDQTSKLVKAGSLPIANELQLKSQVATNELNLINAQNNLDLALLDLKQSLLLPPNDQIDISIPEINMEEQIIMNESIADIYANAELTQPEIKSADLNVESSEVGLQVSKGALYPSLNLNGGFSTNYSDAFQQPVNITPTGLEPTGLVTAVSGEQVLTQGFTSDFETIDFSKQYSDNLSRNLSLSLNIPLFNGFRTQSDIQRSKIFLKQAEVNAKEQRNILYQTIESSYRNAVAAAKSYDASQKQVVALEETLRALENQYNSGAANFTDFQVANNNLIQAQTDLSRAKYDYVFKLKILEFYQGKPLSF